MPAYPSAQGSEPGPLRDNKETMINYLYQSKESQPQREALLKILNVMRENDWNAAQCIGYLDNLIAFIEPIMGKEKAKESAIAFVRNAEEAHLKRLILG